MTDSSSIFSIVFHFWYLIPVVLIVLFFKTPAGKGVVGEYLVKVSAKILLNKKKYYLINNVTLPTESGTTQIDHIIVSPYGIFVIETKNMKGWIFGNEKQKTWTQKIYRYTAKFQNPLHQNYRHTQTLKSLLNLTDKEVFSLVVFAGESTFKTEMPPNVIEGISYIKYIKSKKEIVFADSRVYEIINSIEAKRLKPSMQTNRVHIKNLNERHAEILNKKHTESLNKRHDRTDCPRCGSSMVLRTAKRGVNAGNQFWGCTKYPKCREIKKHNE